MTTLTRYERHPTTQRRPRSILVVYVAIRGSAVCNVTYQHSNNKIEGNPATSSAYIRERYRCRFGSERRAQQPQSSILIALKRSVEKTRMFEICGSNLRATDHRDKQFAVPRASSMPQQRLRKLCTLELARQLQSAPRRIRKREALARAARESAKQLKRGKIVGKRGKIVGTRWCTCGSRNGRLPRARALRPYTCV
eukprot:6187771-Pleurochrysis_carterae.AAC.4